MRTKSPTNQSGVYKITNTLNGKAYIGSAYNIRKRWKSHRNLLRKKRHCNRYFQAAENKYGLNTFIWEILEYIKPLNTKKETAEFLTKREQHWLDFFQTYDRTKGYNLSPTAGMVLGVKHTAESRKHMSESHIGLKQTPETRLKISRSQYKPVYKICTKTGVILEQFPSVISASETTGILQQTISMCCRGIIKQTGGFHWTYNQKTFVKPNLKRKQIKRPWKCKSVSNGIQKWPTIEAACNCLGISWSTFNIRRLQGEFFNV